MTRPPFHRHPHLHLVEPLPPQARHRYETRIVVSSARMPYGRSRAFHLTPNKLDELIEIAERLEARR